VNDNVLYHSERAVASGASVFDGRLSEMLVSGQIDFKWQRSERRDTPAIRERPSA
jgi:hypothetical protein